MIEKITEIYLFLFIGFLTAAGFLHAEKSVQFRNDPAHTGVFSGPGPEKVSRLKWAFQADSAVISSPVVSDGLVFFGSEGGTFYALSAGSGKTAWTLKTGGRISSTPAVSGKKVFFLSAEGFFYALDAGTGRLLWKFQTGGEKAYMETDIFLSSPALVSGKIYFGSSDGFVYCLNEDTGSLIWKTSTVRKGFENAVFSVHSSPGINNGTVYIGNTFGTLFALNADSGKVIWKYDIYAMIQTSPVIYDKKIYFSGKDYTLYSLNASNGTDIWKYTWNDYMKVYALHLSSPAVSDGVVYKGSPYSPVFTAFDAGSGKILWSISLTMEKVLSSPALCGNLVYFATAENYYGTGSGRLYALDKKTGKIRFTFHADGNILSSPFIDSGTIYFATTRGSIYALE